MVTITQTLTALASAAEGRLALCLPRAFYPEDRLQATRWAFDEYCTAEITDGGASELTLQLTVLEPHRSSSRDIVGAFLNYSLCLAVQPGQGKQSEP